MEALHTYIQPEKRLSALKKRFIRLSGLLPEEIAQQIEEDLIVAGRIMPTLISESVKFAEI